MIEEARVSFYKVERCGYYRRAKDKAEFGDLGDILDQLSGWLEGKELGTTSVYEVAEDSRLHPAYCFNLEGSKQGNYLLTLWNQTPSTNNKVPSVSPKSTVGNAKVKLSKIPKGNIPGFATYFWFLPNNDLLATVLFQNRSNGHPEMNKYLQEYMAKCTKYVVEHYDEEADLSIYGYRQSDEDTEQSLFTQFRSRLARKPGQIEILRDKCSAIRKMVKKNHISLHDKHERSFYDSGLRLFGLADSPIRNDDIKVKYEIDFTPTLEELDVIIAKWEQDTETKWDDVGFKLLKEHQTRWLSHTFAKSTIELDVVRQDEEIVTGKSLLKALDAHQKSLIKILQD